MMVNYLNDNFSLETLPEEIIDMLLELYNKIKDKFIFINKNTEIIAIDYSLNNIDLMLDSLNKLTDMLEENTLFKEEYFLSLAIIDDIEYIVLDNPELLKQNLAFIVNVVINFCKLISDKQDMLLSNKIFDYENEYQEFLRFYNIQKEYFYSINTNMDEDYEEVIDKVTNFLW